MTTFFARYRNQITALVITLILTIFQLIRVIAFINVYGGIEHDGGWMLSISRSLAEQGTYTTMVSTIVDPTVQGAINIDEKFDIQAPDGRIWFFTGNGIGPSSIVPDALVLKIFGTDFWTLHIGPLIFYILFLLLAALILYRLAGLWAVILFNAFLFFYPHISIFLSYEAMGEVPAMFYILWAYLVFVWALKQQPQRWWHFLLAGLVVGLALNAKLIALWSLSGIFIWAGVLWLTDVANRSENSIDRPLRFRKLLAFGVGVILPPALWELIQLLVLVRLTSFELYLQHLRQRLNFILDDGSGIGLKTHSGLEFLGDKFFVLQKVTHPQQWVTAIIFLALFVGGLALVWLWCHQYHKQNLLTPMWLGWLVNTIWFVGLAKTGWVRHYWFGLVLAAILLCIIVITFLRIGWTRLQQSKAEKTGRELEGGFLTVGSILLVLLLWGFVSQPYVWNLFIPDELISYWQQKRINSEYTTLPWIIIPRQAQAEAVDYIRQMPAEANVYYPEGYKTAELPVQTGRLHFPIARRQNPNVSPHPDDVIIFSPSTISPWRKDQVMRENVIQLIEHTCPTPVVKNDFYIICRIESLNLQ